MCKQSLAVGTTGFLVLAGMAPVADPSNLYRETEADRHLWLSGRYDNVVYRIDTRTGGVDTVRVGREPHGLTVWPQPGRYSLGHTGNLR
jgi:hypothetical protein